MEFDLEAFFAAIKVFKTYLSDIILNQLLKWIIDYIHVNIIIIIGNNPTSSARLFIAIKRLNNAIENANKHPSVSAKGILMVMIGQSFIIVQQF